MPDAKMTEGERIADHASATMVTSHGNRLPPSIKRWLANEFDAALAAKDAEIERLRGMLRTGFDGMVETGGATLMRDEDTDEVYWQTWNDSSEDREPRLEKGEPIIMAPDTRSFCVGTKIIVMEPANDHHT